jgi:hypothetical protein
MWRGFKGLVLEA